MNGIVLYKSKYGNTLQYAKWIADELNWPLKDFSKFKKREIDEYDQIIFGTAVYMGKMNQLNKALKLFENHPITIFACAGNPGSKKEIEDIKSQNFTEKELDMHRFFYLPGGVDFSKVSGLMKPFIHMYRFILERKKTLTIDEKHILRGFYEPTNYVEKSNIEAIVKNAQKNQ